MRLPWDQPGPHLERLVQAAGVVTPLRLEARPDGAFRIVSGYRRCLVAGKLGLERLPALVVRGEPARLFLSAVCDNMSSGSGLELNERAEVVARLLRDFRYTEGRLIAEILPLLQVPATAHQLRQLQLVADLPAPVRKALSTRLTLDSARILKAWSAEDAAFFIDLADRYQLGTNKQKQILELLEDLRRKEAQTVREIWETSGAASVEGEDGLAPADRFQRFRRLLRQRRFPVLSQYEERAEALQQALSLPAEVQLRLPPYFEGEQVEFLLRVSSPVQLRSVLDRLEAAANRSEMEGLFDLL